MPQALCLLHANCQGDALRPLLETAPAFARHFHIRQYLNYTRQSIAEADLEQCALFLYQRLAPRWGALSTEQMLPRLPAACPRIEIPNLFFKGYWPFWTNAAQGIDFADSLLERLLSQGLAPEEALNLYLRGDPALLGDVAAVAEASLAREEGKEADALIRCAPSCVNAGVRNSSSSPSTIRAEACFFMWRTVCCACWAWAACRKKHAAPTSIRRKISGCPFTPRWDRCWACPLPTATGDTRPSPPGLPIGNTLPAIWPAAATGWTTC